MSTRLEQIAAMLCPVQCNRCSGIYDLTAVKPIAEHIDCSVWKTPCCDRTEDSRPGIRRYTELDQATGLPKGKHFTYYFGEGESQ